YFGLPGAMAALGGMLAVPLVLVILLALVHAQFAGHPGVDGALRGMAAVSAGMIGAAGLKLSGSLARHPLPLAWGVLLAAVAFLMVALVRAPLPYVLFGVGGLACVLTYRRLKA
ncbi:chromate transporter, partial [Massilia cavernae]